MTIFQCLQNQLWTFLCIFLVLGCNNLFSFSPGFVPIDLDEWWAKRFLANIDKLSWHSSGSCESGQTGLGRRPRRFKKDGQRWDARIKKTRTFVFELHRYQCSSCVRVHTTKFLLSFQQRWYVPFLKCSKIVFSSCQSWFTLLLLMTPYTVF